MSGQSFRRSRSRSRRFVRNNATFEFPGTVVADAITGLKMPAGGIRKLRVFGGWLTDDCMMEWQTATPLVATWSYYYSIDRCAEVEVAVSLRCCTVVEAVGGFECQQTAVEARRLGAWRLALGAPHSNVNSSARRNPLNDHRQTSTQSIHHGNHLCRNYVLC
jgi:hypothetical protein